jgi:hypothetical protein
MIRRNEKAMYEYLSIVARIIPTLLYPIMLLLNSKLVFIEKNCVLGLGMRARVSIIVANVL